MLPRLLPNLLQRMESKMINLVKTWIGHELLASTKKDISPKVGDKVWVKVFDNEVDATLIAIPPREGTFFEKYNYCNILQGEYPEFKNRSGTVYAFEYFNEEKGRNQFKYEFLLDKPLTTVPRYDNIKE